MMGKGRGRGVEPGREGVVYYGYIRGERKNNGGEREGGIKEGKKERNIYLRKEV